MKHHHDTPSSDTESDTDSDSWDDSSSDSESDSSDSDADDSQNKDPPNHTALYAIGALILLAVVGGLVYFVSTTSSSASEAVSASSESTGTGGAGGGGKSSAEGNGGGGGTGSEKGTKTTSAAAGSGSAGEGGAGGGGGSKTASASSSSPSGNSSSGSSTSSSKLPPNGWKAGVAGGDGFDNFKDHISWWYDWNADGSQDHTADNVVYFSMLWGDGTLDSTDSSRLSAFKALPTSSPPAYILGFNEPDLDNSENSAGMDVGKAAELWENEIAPWQGRGSALGSPSMGMQGAETWLAEFKGNITTMWDFTAIHVYQKTGDDVQKVIDHYKTYDKPIVITEWGMMDVSSGWEAITDQDSINTYIADCVKLFEEDGDVAGYAAIIDGAGLGDVWPLIKGGEMT
ncbi:hypothetical protein JCM11641_003557 [Rhodosporidiobolus odoratus]